MRSKAKRHPIDGTVLELSNLHPSLCPQLLVITRHIPRKKVTFAKLCNTSVAHPEEQSFYKVSWASSHPTLFTKYGSSGAWHLLEKPWGYAVTTDRLLELITNTIIEYELLLADKNNNRSEIGL